MIQKEHQGTQEMSLMLVLSEVSDAIEGAASLYSTVFFTLLRVLESQLVASRSFGRGIYLPDRSHCP